jgi:hypothetical protein
VVNLLKIKTQLKKDLEKKKSLNVEDEEEE